MKRLARRVRWLGLVGLLCASCAHVEQGSTARAAESTGARPDWTRRPDFGALRAEWALRDDFGERCELRRPMREASELMGAERWRELLALATTWVERCPIDMDAHVVRAIALDRLELAEEAEHHHVWMRGLFEAVLATGDGKTPETAFDVIAIFEEYSLLRFFRYEPKQQTLTHSGIDALSVIADGEERIVYFNPAASFERMERALGKERAAD